MHKPTTETAAGGRQQRAAEQDDAGCGAKPGPLRTSSFAWLNNKLSRRFDGCSAPRALQINILHLIFMHRDM